MSELAQWSADQAADFSWVGLPVNARLCEGWCIFRIKLLGDWKAIAAGLAWPNMGLATSSAIALGPGDWLILSPETDREIALAKIAASQGYAVELSDALVMLELDDAATTLSELTGINAETFGSGRSARTKLAGIGVILTTAANGNVRMIFDVSYARHVRKFLECAI